MTIYLLTDDPYHDNEMYFGAYSTEEKARAAKIAFVVDPENNWRPDRIISFEIDAPPRVNAETEINL